MRTLALLATTSMLVLNAPAAALAHAFLDHAEPRVGNTVPTAPHELKLWFTQKLEQAFSTVEVTDGAGQRVDTGKPRVNGNEMAVTLTCQRSRHLPGELARAVGRYPHDRWQLQFHSR